MALVAEHLKAQLTLLFHTLVLKELVEATAAKLLPVLQEAKGAEIPGLPGVDGAPLHVPLAVAQRRPALHPLPGEKITVKLLHVNRCHEKVLHKDSALQHLLAFCLAGMMPSFSCPITGPPNLPHSRVSISQTEFFPAFVYESLLPSHHLARREK